MVCSNRPFILKTNSFFHINSSLLHNYLKPREQGTLIRSLLAFFGGNMARKFAKSFYNSKAWKDCQSAYKTFRLGICERCGRAEGTEVHHKIILNESNINDPNVSLNFNNLELLCKTCHAQHHNRKYGFTRDDVMFDEFGDLVKRETPTAQGFKKI